MAEDAMPINSFLPELYFKNPALIHIHIGAKAKNRRINHCFGIIEFCTESTFYD